MDGVVFEGTLDPNHIYQCSMCGGLVKEFALVDINGVEYRPLAVRHTGDRTTLCKDAVIERLWPTE